MKTKNKADLICNILKEYKGQEIIRIATAGKTDVADYFIIASGRSSTHTKSLIDHVEEDMEKQGVFAVQKEGIREGRWAVIDYGDIIVHIFNDEARHIYNLEKVWGDEKNTEKF